MKLTLPVPAKIATAMREATSKLFAKIKSLPEGTLLIVLALVTGLCTGAMAVILKGLIELIREGLTSWFSDSSFNLLYLIYPGLGMLLSLLFVKFIVKDDISHGVTKVLKAVSMEKSRIKPRNTWSSIVASSVTIGFGGSVGAEAPIVYSGAALGSSVGRALRLPYKDVTILLGCGAAGAVAGIFKAPLAGVLFTLEILLFNISMTSILPLLVSAVTATVVSYLFRGDALAFTSELEQFSMHNMPYYLILGIFCGFMSLYFIKSTMWCEDRMRRLSKPAIRWAVGALSLGILIYLFPPLYGEGYDSLDMMLSGEFSALMGGRLTSWMLDSRWGILLFFVAILFFKVFATAFTNAGGGVGGTFGPTLFTGGIAGFVVARLINISGIYAVPEVNFVLVGMAGMMAGVMQAPMTAIFLIAEITGGYGLLMPLILTSCVSFATIRFFEKYSIYSKRIAQQGELLTHDSDQAVLTLLNVSDFVEKDFAPVVGNRSLGDLVKIIAQSPRSMFPVLNHQQQIMGVIYLNDVREVMFDQSKYYNTSITEFMKAVPATVSLDEKMESVMQKFEVTGAWNLPVVDEQGKYVGFVSKSKIFSSYREQLQQVSHD